MRGHRWAPQISRRCHWAFCLDCGHVDLKNRVSRKASNAPCPGGQRVKVQILTSAQIKALPKWDQSTTGWKW